MDTKACIHLEVNEIEQQVTIEFSGEGSDLAALLCTAFESNSEFLKLVKYSVKMYESIYRK